jgi:predicted ATP-dependent serine protease
LSLSTDAKAGRRFCSLSVSRKRQLVISSARLGLQHGDVCAQLGVVEQRLAGLCVASGEFARVVEPLAAQADVGDARAFVRQQELRAIPALVLLADQVANGHAHLVEEDFVEMVLAVDGVDRRIVMPGCGRSAGKMPLLLRASVSVRTRANTQSASAQWWSRSSGR